MHHRAQTRKQRRDRHESSSTFFTSTRRGVARLHAPHMRFAQLYGVRPAATEKKCDDFASRWCPVLYTLRARHSVGFRTVKMSAEVVRGHARFRSAISDFPAGLVQVRASATYTKSRGVKTGERGFRFVVRRSNSTKWRACVVKWSPSSHSQCRCACTTHLSHDDAHRDASRVACESVPRRVRVCRCVYELCIEVGFESHAICFAVPREHRHRLSVSPPVV